jgi:ABC-type phosphate transport system substrate-binding protein
MQLRKQVLPIVALVLALGVMVPLAGAQPDSVTIDGSPALFVFAQTTGLAYSEATGTDVIVNISGDTAAVEALCTNQLDIAALTRPLTDAELAICRGSSVQTVELIVGYDGLAVFASNPETTCLTLDELATVFGEEGPAVSGRGREYQQYFMDAVGLDAMREDFVSAGDDLSAGAALMDSEDAVAFVSLAGAMASGETPVAIDAGDGCVAPDSTTISDGSYPLARTMYLYASVGAGERVNVDDFVDYLLTADNLSRLPGLGLIPASEDVYALNVNNWALRATGRTFSAPPVVEEEIEEIALELAALETADYIPYTVVPELAAAVSDLTADITDRTSAALTYDASTLDDEAAMARLCNGETDLAATRRPMTDAELAACEASGIDALTLTAGQQAAVVVINESNAYATCLSQNQVNLIFAAANENLIVRWEQMREDFPPFDLDIYVPDNTAAFERIVGPLRADVTTGDVIAGVSDSDNSVGVVSYAEYVAGMDAVSAAAINAGDGCITPTPDVIQGGVYPLARPVYVTVNTEALARPAVQVLAADLVAGDALRAAGVLPPTTAEYTAQVRLLQDALALAD